MSNLAELKGRVADAVGRLNDAQTKRRQGNEALARLLGDLEEKYRARNEELDYCARRIEALAAENRELEELAERLIGIVEGAFSRGTDDPVYHASAMASDLLSGWSAEPPAETRAAPADPAPPARFEEVSEAELAGELADELLDGAAGELPPPLIEASAAHLAMSFPQGPVVAPELPVPVEAGPIAGDDPADGLVELVEEAADGEPADAAPPVADIEIPELVEDASAGDPGEHEAHRDPEASIRAMMARLDRVERMDASPAASRKAG